MLLCVACVVVYIAVEFLRAEVLQALLTSSSCTADGGALSGPEMFLLRDVWWCYVGIACVPLLPDAMQLLSLAQLPPNCCQTVQHLNHSR
jgi:hypothetical protein